MQCSRSIALIKKVQKTEIIIRVGDNFPERGGVCLGRRLGNELLNKCKINHREHAGYELGAIVSLPLADKCGHQMP